MSDALVPFQPDALQRRAVVRNLRMSARGVAFAALVAGVVVSGLLPMSASAGATLVTLAAALAFTRALRGLYAVRVARNQLRGWRRRRSPRAIATTASADERAIALLTQGDAPVVQKARARGLELAAQVATARHLLEDPALSPVLRRPVAEQLTRTEGDLEALFDLLAELQATGAQARRDDLLQRLAARLEVDRLPVGGLVPA